MESCHALKIQAHPLFDSLEFTLDVDLLKLQFGVSASQLGLPGFYHEASEDSPSHVIPPFHFKSRIERQPLR